MSVVLRIRYDKRLTQFPYSQDDEDVYKNYAFYAHHEI